MNTQNVSSVGEYMNRTVHTIDQNATFQQAVEKMIEEKTNGLVIVDRDQKIAGILSCWDIIQHLVPDYLEKDRHLASFESADIFSTRITDIADTPLSSFMTRRVVTVQDTDPLIEAAAKLSEFRIRQLPVVDVNNELVGYINRTDIKRAIGDVLKKKSS